MTSRNDITGDSILTKASSDAYRDNWDKIFGKRAKGDSSDDQTTSEAEAPSQNTSTVPEDRA